MFVCMLDVDSSNVCLSVRCGTSPLFVCMLDVDSSNVCLSVCQMWTVLMFVCLLDVGPAPCFVCMLDVDSSNVCLYVRCGQF